MAAQPFIILLTLPGEIQKHIWLFAEADATKLAEQQLDLLYKESKGRDDFIYNLSIRAYPDGLYNAFLGVDKKHPIVKSCLATFYRGTITAIIDIFPRIDRVETDEMSESEVYKLHDTYSGITDELYTDLGGTGAYGKRIDAAGSLGKAIPEKLEQREFESIVPTTMNWILKT